VGQGSVKTRHCVINWLLSLEEKHSSWRFHNQPSTLAGRRRPANPGGCLRAAFSSVIILLFIHESRKRVVLMWGIFSNFSGSPFFP
jgi:hypothetical protein